MQTTPETLSPTPNAQPSIRRCTCGKILRGEYEYQCKKCHTAENLAWLKKILPPGSTVYTKVDHVSKSGMFRRISAYAMVQGEPIDISGRAADVMGWTWDRDRGGVKVSGCGMDMGFHLVYCLSRTMYRETFPCIGRGKQHFNGCPSNDHSNGMPYHKGRKHSDGGYALRQRWL